MSRRCVSKKSRSNTSKQRGNEAEKKPPPYHQQDGAAERGGVDENVKELASAATLAEQGEEGGWIAESENTKRRTAVLRHRMSRRTVQIVPGLARGGTAGRSFKAIP